MKDSSVLALIMILAFLTLIYDTIFSDIAVCLKMQPDKRKKILIVLIAIYHHTFSIFGFFGWMFNNKIILSIYVMALVGMVIQWKLNNNECLATQGVSNLSGNKNYKKFNDIYKIIGIKKLIRPRYLYYGSLALCISVALYKIFLR